MKKSPREDIKGLVTLSGSQPLRKEKRAMKTVRPTSPKLDSIPAIKAIRVSEVNSGIVGGWSPVSVVTVNPSMPIASEASMVRSIDAITFVWTSSLQRLSGFMTPWCSPVPSLEARAPPMFPLRARSGGTITSIPGNLMELLTPPRTDPPPTWISAVRSRIGRAFLIILLTFCSGKFLLYKIVIVPAFYSNCFSEPGEVDYGGDGYA